MQQRMSGSSQSDASSILKPQKPENIANPSSLKAEEKKAVSIPPNEVPLEGFFFFVPHQVRHCPGDTNRLAGLPGRIRCRRPISSVGPLEWVSWWRHTFVREGETRSLTICTQSPHLVNSARVWRWVPWPMISVG